MMHASKSAKKANPSDAISLSDALSAGKTILIMDGDCALCSRVARTIARRDVGDQFRILPAQTGLACQIMRENGIDPDDPESWLYWRSDEVLTGASAVIAVSKSLGFPLSWAATLGQACPGPMRESVYRFVARNRISWFGRGDLCALPDPELKRRIIQDS